MAASGSRAKPPGQELPLEDAIEALRSPPALDSQEKLQAHLHAIQAVCSGLVGLVSSGGRLPLDLLEGALQAVAQGLAAARQQVEAAAGQLAALRAAAWSEALLAVADACFHSEAWHAAWHADRGPGGGREGYRRTVELARDALKNDLLPLLCGGAAQLSSDTGFCLGPQFRALLDMGRTAAEVVGMRDPRHRRPGLRNFSVLNVLWNGIQAAWLAVPPDARADMEAQGLGGDAVVESVLRCLRKDVGAAHELLDPGVSKLLLYWLQKARFVLVAYPGAGAACWGSLLEVPLCGHAEVDLLAAAATGGNAAASGNAAQLAEALRDKVLPKAVGLMALCLSSTADEGQLRVMLGELRMRMAGEQPAAAVAHAMRTALPLLRGAAGLSTLARHHCLRLLDAVLDALAGPACVPMLRSAELREAVPDAVLAFLAACCHTAASAAGNGELSPALRQMESQTWASCQAQLFLHALKPHPLTAHVLGAVWTDLAGSASEALLKAHASGLRELLRVAAATEAAGGYGPPSALQTQLVGLLACLLSAAPPATLDGYFANFLQVPPGARVDACQLACLCAELRLAALVDGATGGAAAAAQVHAVLRSLYDHLMAEAPGLVVTAAASGSGGAAAAGHPTAASGTAEAAGLYLAWLTDALQCAVAYITGTGVPHGESADVLAALPNRLAFLVQRGMQKGVLGCVAPALCALRDLGASTLRPEELASFVPTLAACQKQPELAAAAAGVAPLLAHCPAPHAEVLQAALAAPGPLLHHAGWEAFRLYAQACPAAALTKALPPSMLNPETGLMLESCTSVLQQYTQRCPAGSPGASEQDLAALAAALRQESLGAHQVLLRAAEVARARSDAEAAAAPEAGEPDAGSSAVAAAVQQVVRGVQAAEAAVQGAPLDAAAVQALRECTSRLAALLAGTPMA